MNLDILIFAAIAAFLIYRLNSVLGTRHGDERQRPNPFTPKEQKTADTTDPSAPKKPQVIAPPLPVISPGMMDELIDKDANVDGKIEQGLEDIRSADPYFDLNSFMQGARYAFELIVKAYARGDLPALQPLVSTKLYGDFAAGVKSRNEKGHQAELIIHRIKSAQLTGAHLGGTMAYVTVALEVEETSFTRDASGTLVDGDPDAILTIRDVWTFTRDTRITDPNWILIETRAAEQ